MAEGAAGPNPVILPLFVGPCAPGTPAAAREALREGSAAVPLGAQLREDLALVSTELITNAVRAGSMVCIAVLHIWGSVGELRVSDDAPGEARLVDPSPSEDHGRGLRIVAAIAVSWGQEPSPLGKTVWARFAREPAGGGAPTR
jgi:hypothetical protein